MKLFPAHAGVILGIRQMHSNALAIPRTRGGDPKDALRQVLDICYSPHTRG